MKQTPIFVMCTNSFLAHFFALYEEYREVTDINEATNLNDHIETKQARWYFLSDDVLNFVVDEYDVADDDMSSEEKAYQIWYMFEDSTDRTWELFGRDVIQQVEARSIHYPIIKKWLILHYIYILSLKFIIQHYDQLIKDENLTLEKYRLRYINKKGIFDELHEALSSEYLTINSLKLPDNNLIALKNEIDAYATKLGDLWRQIVLDKAKEYMQ